MEDDLTTAVFVSTNGAEGWEDDLAGEALSIGATVLRVPTERGVVIPEQVGDGALLLSVAAAARQLVRLVVFLLDRLQSGVVVDCRPDTPTVSRSTELHRGEMLLIDNDGARVLRPNDRGVLSDVDIAAVVRRLGSSRKQES
ncbi:MAG: hypothetical protein QOD92_435 [Acidimicrobiaceae bacterium]|jgi:hypothetical protein